MNRKPWPPNRHEKHSAFIRRRWKEGRYANRSTEAFKAKCSAAAKARYARPGEREKMSTSAKKAWAARGNYESIERRQAIVSGAQMIRSTRKQAIERGSDKYFTGRPCHRRHISPRYVSSRRCIECILEDNAKLQEAMPR